MVGKGGLPPPDECLSILAESKPPFPTMRLSKLTMDSQLGSLSETFMKISMTASTP